MLTERYSVQKRAAAASGKRRHAKGLRPCTLIFTSVRNEEYTSLKTLIYNWTFLKKKALPVQLLLQQGIHGATVLLF